MADQPARRVADLRPTIRKRLPARAILRALLVAALGTSVVIGPSAVLARCVPPPPMPEAVAGSQNVFVGTVVALAAQNRWATVQVEEVWKGHDTGPIVEVRGGETEEAFSSIDRTYAIGVRYVFVVGFGNGLYTDNSCTATAEWDDAFLPARPADWFSPEGAVTPEPGGGIEPTHANGIDLTAVSERFGPLIAIGGVALIVIGGSWLVARRRYD